MARRILSADAALVPQAQTPLDSVRTEARHPALAAIQRHWEQPPHPAVLDWADRTGLMEEIRFVNEAQEFLDEAAVKIAPAVLRIVLTVKRHIAEPAGQRAFLAEHLTLDLRRVSELCIVADSYRLLDPQGRAAGEAEIARYGWSKALKLAHVPDPADRRDIWRRACAGRETASYRAVLEEIRRFRERKQLPASAEPALPVTERVAAFRQAFGRFDSAAGRLETPRACQEALGELGRMQRELQRVRRALRERIEVLQHEEWAASS